MCESSSHCTSLPILGIVSLFNFTSSTRWEVTGFNLRFANRERYWWCFHVLCWWSHIFFKCLLNILARILLGCLLIAVSSYKCQFFIRYVFGKHFHFGTIVFFREQTFEILMKSILSVYQFSLLSSSKYFLIYFVFFMSSLKWVLNFQIFQMFYLFI